MLTRNGWQRWLCILGAGLLLLTAGPARAQQCFLGPVGVPGLWGPPNWYGPAATSSDWTGSFGKLHDPRWAGSPLVTFASAGGAGEAEYRVVSQGDHLYLSFHALADYIEMGASVDTVFFGFSLGTTLGSHAYLVRVDVNSSGSDPIATSVAQVDHWNGGSWNFDIATPAWIEESHSWVSDDLVDWAVNLKIKAKGAGGAGVTGDFHVVFAMGWDLGGAGVVEYSTPNLSGFGGPYVNAALHIPRDHTAWAPAKQPGSACPGGVSMEAYDIQTTHPDGRSMYTGTGSDPEVNTFVIKPKHVRGRVPQLQHTVRVRLSVADWGAQIADPASSEWNPVHGTKTFLNDAGTWTWAWDGGGGGPAADAFDDVTINFTCAKELASHPFCPILANIPTSAADKERARHQCMLAELRGDPNPANSGHLTFTTAATYNNLDFVELSTFEREAKISLKGLQKVTGEAQDRDVYLYVKKRNMPEHGETAMELPVREMAMLKRFAQNPPKSPFLDQEELEKQRKLANSASSPLAALLRQEKIDELPLQYSSASRHELLSGVWPIYQIHAYYDTGKTRSVGGVERKILRPLVPFGYLLHHSGPFYGFSDSIEGLDGVVLEEVSQNLYKVRIENEGAIRIKSAITAHEAPPRRKSCKKCCDCKPPVVNVNVRGCYCRTAGAPDGPIDESLALLCIVPLLGLVARRRRRQPSARQRFWSASARDTSER